MYDMRRIDFLLLTVMLPTRALSPSGVSEVKRRDKGKICC